MEDYIPFLIVILISIVGAASRKKKKRSFSENVSATQQATPKNDFMSWMEKLAGEDESIDPYKQEAPIVEEVPVEKVVESKSYESISSRKEQYSKQSGVITPEEKAELIAKQAPRITKLNKDSDLNNQIIEEDEIGSENTAIDFDLRKAVIFTEILNRKYT